MTEETAEAPRTLLPVEEIQDRLRARRDTPGHYTSRRTYEKNPAAPGVPQLAEELDNAIAYARSEEFRDAHERVGRVLAGAKPDEDSNIAAVRLARVLTLANEDRKLMERVDEMMMPPINIIVRALRENVDSAHEGTEKADNLKESLGRIHYRNGEYFGYDYEDIPQILKGEQKPPTTEMHETWFDVTDALGLAGYERLAQTIRDKVFERIFAAKEQAGQRGTGALQR